MNEQETTDSQANSSKDTRRDESGKLEQPCDRDIDYIAGLCYWTSGIECHLARNREAERLVAIRRGTGAFDNTGNK